MSQATMIHQGDQIIPTTQDLKPVSTNLTCDEHDESQEGTVQNAAQALLLLRARIYENKEITNEILLSLPSSDDETKNMKHQ